MKNPKERTKMFERISQSLELAGEYDKKKEALLKAKEDTQYHFNKKRAAAAEKKQVSLDKIEVRMQHKIVIVWLQSIKQYALQCGRNRSIFLLLKVCCNTFLCQCYYNNVIIYFASLTTCFWLN